LAVEGTSAANMNDASLILLATAAGVGGLHTLLGVDHTLPFVLLARAQRWSLRRLLAVTAACGAAHVLSSVVIGSIGVALGVALDGLVAIDALRGTLGARLLIGAGLAYAVWGIWQARRGHRHSHAHRHDDGTVHAHEHDHQGEHVHAHGARRRQARTLTVAGLFVLLVLGPCEPLIPLLFPPAFEGDWLLVAGIVASFGLTTLAAMLAVVTVGHLGLRFRGGASLERHAHALAGLAIAASGLAIDLLG
jgi:ABC-type nickel/cobalt efflux system permease component RcnA